MALGRWWPHLHWLAWIGWTAVSFLFPTAKKNVKMPLLQEDQQQQALHCMSMLAPITSYWLEYSNPWLCNKTMMMMMHLLDFNYTVFKKEGFWCKVALSKFNVLKNFIDRIKMQTNFRGHKCIHSNSTTRFVRINASKLADQQTWNYQTKNHSLLIGARWLKLRGQIEKKIIYVSLGTCMSLFLFLEGAKHSCW